MAAEEFGPYRLGTLIGRGGMGEVRCAHGASALDAAHADGLLHRDVKPSNVLLAATAGGDDIGYQARLRVLLCEHARIGWASRADKAIAAALIGVVGAVIAAVVGAAAVRWFEPDLPQKPDLPPLTTTTLTPAPPAIAYIHVGDYPVGVAVSPDGRHVYITNANADTVSVIDIGIG